MSERDGGPAFPIQPPRASPGEWASGAWSSGMSLRDWFAGQALAGLMADASMDIKRETAVGAYRMADFMLEAGGAAPTTREEVEGE